MKNGFHFNIEYNLYKTKSYQPAHLNEKVDKKHSATAMRKI